MKVTDAWVRPAVKGQAGTGGYMRLTSPQPMTLTGFTTQVAALAELHEMAMDGDVMRMGQVDALPLPAGQPVDLKPGGHHLMLMNLRKALKPGSHILVTLKLRTPDGQTVLQEVKLPVRATAPGPIASGAGPAHIHGHSHAHGSH